MRIYKKLSPVSYKVRPPSNSQIGTTAHVNRKKPYYDRHDKPILPPDEDDLPQPYLRESEIPDDNFEEHSDHDDPAQLSSSSDSGSDASPIDCSPSSPDVVSEQTVQPATSSESFTPPAAPSTSSDDSSTDVCQVERIL